MEDVLGRVGPRGSSKHEPLPGHQKSARSSNPTCSALTGKHDTGPSSRENRRRQPPARAIRRHRFRVRHPPPRPWRARLCSLPANCQRDPRVGAVVVMSGPLSPRHVEGSARWLHRSAIALQVVLSPNGSAPRVSPWNHRGWSVVLRAQPLFTLAYPRAGIRIARRSRIHGTSLYHRLYRARGASATGMQAVMLTPSDLVRACSWSRSP